MVTLETDFVSDLDVVLDKWRGILKVFVIRAMARINFFQNVIGEKNRLEAEMSQPNYVSNLVLNDEYSYNEIEMALHNSKNKESTVIDGIPNEPLKQYSDISCVRFYVWC